ncbi:hypothetical protein CHUAL_012067 [Chamberlinius hualienensis]
MAGKEASTLVFDFGSGMCKAGFAYDDTPRAIFPSIIGLPKQKSSRFFSLNHQQTQNNKEKESIQIMFETFETSAINRIWCYDIKEKLCFVSLDFDKDTSSHSVNKTYQLPDGKFIILGNERFSCPEALFKPQFIGKANHGIHDAIYQSVMACDKDICPNLFKNIVISGGSSMSPGIAERLMNEINDVAPPAARVEIVANSKRQYSAWIGGAVLVNTSTFQGLCITKKGV